MKLAEVKVLDDSTVYLNGGWVLEYDDLHSLPKPGAAKIWIVKRLLDEEELAEASILSGLTADESIFKITPMDDPSVIARASTRYRAISEKQKLEAFYDWVEKKLSTITEDLFSDSRKARQQRTQDAKPVTLVRLNKDGSESGMSEARSYHTTEEDAKRVHDSLVKNNPGTKIAHHMYSFNGDETFKTKFVGGKVVPLKGGISSEPDIDDAVDAFIEMLDDEGSAAGIWMSQSKKRELYKLYKAKYKVKATGVSIEDMEPAVADRALARKKATLQKNGWTLFAEEAADDYVDMVFTKGP